MFVLFGFFAVVHARVDDVFSSHARVATVPDLTTHQHQSAGRSRMRALLAAATGLALAVAAVLALTALGTPTARTSPEPLLTTVPAHP
ncbi:SPW_0924 family protein [Streptomyces collinus]|uniref:SPW_0924 family protein n=1 Tax=Streptomyces collinus TaxID=42684 RepID=UPI0010E198F9